MDPIIFPSIPNSNKKDHSTPNDMLVRGALWTLAGLVLIPWLLTHPTETVDAELYESMGQLIFWGKIYGYLLIIIAIRGIHKNGV